MSSRCRFDVEAKETVLSGAPISFCNEDSWYLFVFLNCSRHSKSNTHADIWCDLRFFNFGASRGVCYVNVPRAKLDFLPRRRVISDVWRDRNLIYITGSAVARLFLEPAGGWSEEVRIVVQHTEQKGGSAVGEPHGIQRTIRIGGHSRICAAPPKPPQSTRT
jgi:hypothetical protein